jgi:photosystem II stability/assembly factor-like uncharacterized protein
MLINRRDLPTFPNLRKGANKILPIITIRNLTFSLKRHIKDLVGERNKCTQEPEEPKMRTNRKHLIVISWLFSITLLATGSACAAPLYFPHVVTSIPRQTEIAIINTSPDQNVTGTLRAFSDEGQLVGAKEITLPNRGRRQIVIADEFTNPTDIGYIIFDTDSDTVQGYMKFYREGYYRAAIPAVKGVNTSDIYVPHMTSSAEWWTALSLVNTTSAAKELTITFNDGQSRLITLNANEHKAFDIISLFDNQPQPDIQSAVITNAEGVIGLELFGSNGVGNQLDGILLTGNTATTLYYPHVAGDGWWTGIVAYCPSWLYFGITITSYSAEGTCLSSNYLSVTGHKYIGTVVDLGFPDQTAWFKIDSMQGIDGFELFGAVDGNRLAAYAGRGGDGAMSGVFPKIEKNGWTEIVFINTEDSEATITMTAYNDNGGTVATQALTVNGHTKAVNRAEAIFSQDITGATYIVYSSDREVVGFQFNESSDGTMLDGLSALPGGGSPNPSSSATSWQQIAGPEGGDIQVLAIDPSNSQVVYAGNNGGGIFKTTDGGATWTAINTGLGPEKSYVESLAIDPTNRQIVYAGTDGGIFKTTDGGATWTAINNGLTSTHVSSLAIDHSNSQIVYAGTQGSGDGTGGGVFKTTDGGASWTAMNTGLASTRVSCLAIDPKDSRVVYAGTWDVAITETGGDVFKTTDGGATWTAMMIDTGLANTMISHLAIDPKDSRVVYAVDGNTIFKTTNGGASWKAIDAGIINTGISALAIDPVNSKVVYVGTIGVYGCAGGNGGDGCGPDISGSVFKTADGGASWKAIKTGITNDLIYSLAIDPTNRQIVYAGTNNNGVFKTTNGGSSWAKINTGTNGEVDSLAIDPANSKTVYAGTWGGGAFKTTNGGVSWTTINTDITDIYVTALAIDPADSQMVYAGTYLNNLFKTTDGGASWTAVFYTGTNGNVSSLAIDPANSQIVYAGTGAGVFKTTNGGAYWWGSCTGLTNRNVSFLAIDPENSQTVYAGTSTGVFKTTDGGTHWRATFTAIQNSSVSSLAIEPANSQIVYAGTSAGVFKTTNGGASWTAINTGITNTNILSLAIDPANSRIVYAGTLSGGVFKTTNGGTSWTAINTGLKNMLICSIAVDPTNSRIVYAGTGGGVFKMLE